MFHQSLCTVWWRLNRLSQVSSLEACAPASEDIAAVTDRSTETALASESGVAGEDPTFQHGSGRALRNATHNTADMALLPHLPAPT